MGRFNEGPTTGWDPAHHAWVSSPFLAPLFGPIPVGGASKDQLESRGPL